MIRQAVIDDLPDIVRLAVQMHNESRFMKFLFHEEKVRAFLSTLIDAPDGFLWVADDGDGEVIGAMAATVFELWFSSDRIAQDVGLFVRPSRRGTSAAAALVDRYLVWARERGAVDAEIGVSTGVHPDRTGAFLQRLGGREVGRLYSWESICA